MFFTNTLWPSLILATSCSSTSARTRTIVMSPMTINGISGAGATISPTLALICNTLPAMGARMRVLSRTVSASVTSDRAAMSPASNRFGATAPDLEIAEARAEYSCRSWSTASA